MFFHMYVNHSFGFSNVYFSTGTRYFVYLCGTEWRALIFRISQNLPYLFGGLENGLNVVLIQYLADTVCCSFYVWENGKGSFARLILLCVWGSLSYWCVCWLFYLYLFYHVRFFVRLVSNGWVPSVSILCQR